MRDRQKERKSIMKVLWLCNIVLPMAARQMGMEVSNKEGWVSGMAESVLAGHGENRIELFLCPAADFPGGRKSAAGRWRHRVGDPFLSTVFRRM